MTNQIRGNKIFIVYFFYKVLFFELFILYLHHSSPLILYELKGISLIKCV